MKIDKQNKKTLIKTPNSPQYSGKTVTTAQFKSVLSELLQPIDNYVLMLSGGVDSRSIFFEGIEQKKNFKCKPK